MVEHGDSDPTSGIRAVLLVGFLSGDTFGLLYLTFTGHLLESLWLNPLALFGAFLGIGMVGAMIGSVFGLSSRMLLGKRWAKNGWLVPVLVAGTASGVAGLLQAYVLVALVFQSS